DLKDDLLDNLAIDLEVPAITTGAQAECIEAKSERDIQLRPLQNTRGSTYFNLTYDQDRSAAVADHSATVSIDELDTDLMRAVRFRPGNQEFSGEKEVRGLIRLR